ncbi:MAG: DNA polymerase III subunit gamma/tau [Daejeonella sp.]|uniref:DNA polymerase III subunit gamma/tau n=1 Tax=Daejeonella sp. TaxID=2805397 RepID=UPI002736A390|nr:DNA polymerase III subunit gamma/tau [Daejeonella sp.]MDP3469478.1 DNA polymerase III subunit gamma/tau [Daejeonella sp.]
MDNFIVSARKYRPATFQTVVGQQHITGTLKNAIKNNQLAQAFLFCGPRGVGKTTCARILAKTINCQNLTADAEACGECNSCISFQNGNSFNFHELDAASNNSVEDIRNLIEQVRIPPQAGKYKVYIIDEVHMLSQQAFNAFLKTLEEPPHYAIFILATTEKHKILPTILSRCQIFDFNRIRVEDMAQHLAEIADKEGIAYDQDGLHMIAQKADGGLRDALSMFDQIVSFSNKNVNYKAVIDNLNILDYDYYFKLTDAILSEDVSGSLLIFDEILSHGFDGNHFITGLASHFRNLLVCRDSSTLKLLEVSEGIRQKYQLQSQTAPLSFLISALNISNQCDLNYKTSKNQRLQVELALIKLCHIPAVINLSAAGMPQIPEGEVKKKLNPEVKTEISVKPDYPFHEKEITPGIQTLEEPKKITASAEAPATEFQKSNLKPEADAKKPIVSMPRPSLSPNSAFIPNLNDLEANYTKKEEERPEYLSGDSKLDFSADSLLRFWNTYAAKIKNEGKINIFTIMTSYPPRLLPEYIIELDIENKLQEELLHSEKVELLNFLRTELKNYSIDLQTKLLEQIQKKRLYTSNEKYQHMLEKNPNLEEFRKRFNLDLDF